MTRRQGTIIRRGAAFVLILNSRDPATGKRKRRWMTLEVKTAKEAEIERTRLINTLNEGELPAPGKTTLAVFLPVWLAHKKPNVSPSTFERYEDLALKNIAPLLGSAVLTKLQPIQISTAYASAVSSGRRSGTGGLSPRTVHHMHRVLKQALDQAVKWKQLKINPCDGLERTDRPKIEKKPVATIDAPATMDAIEAARSHRMFVAFLLGSLCGLRRGEICALSRKSVDLDRATAAVVASIEQTKAGCREKDVKGSKTRTVALPSLLVDELRAWYRRQAEEMLRLGTRPTGDTKVFTREDGGTWRPSDLTKAVSKFMKAQGSGVRLHGLRHSHASHLLAENVHPKIVQERLGHATISVTMDIYSHLLPNMQADAVSRVDDVLKAAQKKRQNDVG